jgi:hypothetical protein
MKFRSGLPAIVILAMTTLLLTGGSVFAGYGSVAYDQDARKQGVSSDEATQQDAERAAMKKCGSENCKLRFKIPVKMCAAFATPENGPAWGGAVRKSIDAAKFAALKTCQKHANEKCAVRDSACDK